MNMTYPCTLLPPLPSPSKSPRHSSHSTIMDFPQHDNFKVLFPTEHIAHVQIDRPQKLNAFTQQMWESVASIFDSLSASPSIRCILLSGSTPSTFTAGLDLSAFVNTPSSSYSTDPARTALALQTHITSFQRSISAIANCRHPVIALLHGHCLGLGIDIVCCAAIRLCTPGARMSVKEVDVGLAADVGTLSRLPRIVGSGSWVKEVCLTAREWGADEALCQGFVSRVVGKGGAGSAGLPAAERLRQQFEVGVQEALALAGVIAQKSPVAVLGTKAILDQHYERHVPEGLQFTSIWNSAMLQTEDLEKSVRAITTRNKAIYAKL